MKFITSALRQLAKIMTDKNTIQISKLFAVSDLHVDYKLNKEYVFSWKSSNYDDAGLIIAGDVTDDLELLKETLKHFTNHFGAVFFVPGK